MSLPYFPFYPSDFEAKTSHLSLEEDGAYNRLLRLMWMTPGCSLPDDPVWIARRLRVDAATYDRVVAPVIAEFFKRARKRRVWTSPLIEACVEKHRRSTPRPWVPLHVQRQVHARDGRRCRYCMCSEGPFHLDHVVPWAHGGAHDPENLVVACATCNWAKGDRSLEEMGWAL